jgi:hypothetical protein
MATGGVVSLRVGLVGSEQVKTALAELGPAGAQALRQIEQAQAGPTAGMRALDAAGAGVSDRMKEFSGNAGIAGSALMAIGPAGLAAGAGVGALLEALSKAKETADWAETLEKTAAILNVSTTSLQEFDFATAHFGIESEAARGALERLNEALGAVQSGVGDEKLKKAFAALGFTPQEIESFHSVGDFLPVFADRLNAVGDKAEEARIAEKLGIAPLLPLLAQGSAGLKDLSQKADDLGSLVGGETVESLSRMRGQMNDAASEMKGGVRTAFVELTPIVAGLESVVGRVATGFGLLIQKLREFATADTRFSEAGKAYASDLSEADDIKTASPAAAFLKYGIWPGQNRAPLIAQKQADAAAAYARMMALNPNWTPPEAAAASQPHRLVPPRGGAGAQGPTQDEIDRNSAIAAAQADQDIQKARKDELTAQLALTTDVVQRAAIQGQIADIEQQAAKDAVDKQVAEKKGLLAAGKISEADYDNFVASEDLANLLRAQTDAEKKALEARVEAQQLADQRNQLAQIDLENARNLAQAQLAVTTNLAARRDLALKIFQLDEQLAEQKLQEVIASKTATDAQKADAQDQLAGLRASAPARRDGASRANPGDAFSAMLEQMRGQVNGLDQAFSTMAADGVGQFNQSLFDAQGRMNNLGQVASQVFSRMLGDLEQYLLKQAEVGLFSGGGGGGGGFLGSLFSLFSGGGGAAGAGASAIPADLVGLMADGGWIHGPGGPRSDGVLIAASPGEYIVNAQAAHTWGPVLDAINTGQPMRIPHFADGGMVGRSFTGGAAGWGATTVHLYVDRSISAPGADPAQLQRVAARQEELLRQEPTRVVGYVGALKKRGFVH